MPGVLRFKCSNINQFVDKMFDNEVRDPKKYIKAAAAIQDTDLCPLGVAALWFADQSDIDFMLAAWLDGWKDPDDVYGGCPDSDRDFLKFLASYIKDNDMVLWMPRLEKKSTFSNVAKGVLYNAPRYRIDAWRQHKLLDGDDKWIDDNVKRLLMLFAAGAHFIVLHNELDTNIESGDFYSNYASTFGSWTPWGGLKNTAIGHSHYRYHGSKGPIPSLGTAYSYPYITGETAPLSNCPFICSLIVDTTAWKGEDFFGDTDYNTFFQLEGWPGTYVKGKLGIGGRHGKDFALHQATIWNISTYGLCPYSEKRSTPVFLAPAAYRFKVPKYKMRMPVFAGARDTQSWWRPEATTPAIPEIVYDE